MSKTVDTASVVRFHKTGGPEVLQMDQVPLAPPAAGEVQIEHKAIGLNFIEIYYRTGMYPSELPTCPGTEAAGVVIAVGEGVTEFAVGDRVAYATGPVGAYSTHRNLSANVLVPIPDGISFEQAAAIMLKGLTAQYLLRRTFKVGEGQTILFHAAAGGVGLLACQWANALGAKVIGTVSSEAKAEVALANGCSVVVNTSKESFKTKVMELTGGHGLPVVYDSVGKATFDESLDCLQPCGLMVSYGAASGPVDPVPLTALAKRGSLFLTRPTIYSYMAKREDLLASAADLFDAVLNKGVQVHINQRYALKDAAQAHAALSSRQTTGCSVLLP